MPRAAWPSRTLLPVIWMILAWCKERSKIAVELGS
jgi:hypothetical protein